MAALRQEQGNDRDVPDALGRQSSNGGFESGRHAFQKGEFDSDAGLLLAQASDDPAERLSPAGIAGAMREQNHRRSKRRGHAEIERSRILPSVADWETGRSVGAA